MRHEAGETEGVRPHVVLKPRPPVPEKATVVGDRAFTEQTKVKRGPMGGPGPRRLTSLQGEISMPVAPGPRGGPARVQREAAILKPGTEASEDTEPASTSTLAPRGPLGTSDLQDRRGHSVLFSVTKFGVIRDSGNGSARRP